jgi:hypothetical protein
MLGKTWLQTSGQSDAWLYLEVSFSALRNCNFAGAALPTEEFLTRASKNRTPK